MLSSIRLLDVGYLFLFAAVLSGCNSTDQQESLPEEESGKSSLFFDYRISGEEGMEMVKTVLQFHEMGPMGRAVAIDSPGSVSLDGEPLAADSANFTGVYYEKMSPEPEFSGDHRIVINTPEGEKFAENFRFEPLKIRSELPNELYRSDGLRLELDGLKNGDMVRLVATDTSFSTNDINILEPVREGVVELTPAQLHALSTGPIVLYISRELEREVEEGTAQGGQIAISYSLQRSFNLNNQP